MPRRCGLDSWPWSTNRPPDRECLRSVSSTPPFTPLASQPDDRVFHDITVGSNAWPQSPTKFYAATGYDLCDGWGTPKGQATINALVGYAGPIWVNFSDACPGNGSYTNAYCTLALGVSAVTSGGTVCLVGPNSTTATISISKPLTLRAFFGPVTVGN